MIDTIYKEVGVEVQRNTWRDHVTKKKNRKSLEGKELKPKTDRTTLHINRTS